MQSASDTPSSHCGRCGAPLCGAPLRPQDVRGFKQGCRHFPSPGGRRTHPPGITRENATLRMRPKQYAHDERHLDQDLQRHQGRC